MKKIKLFSIFIITALIFVLFGINSRGQAPPSSPVNAGATRDTGITLTGPQVLYYKFILSDNNTHKGYSLYVWYTINGTDNHTEYQLSGTPTTGVIQCDNIFYVPLPTTIDCGNAAGNTIRAHIKLVRTSDGHVYDDVTKIDATIPQGCSFPYVVQMNICGASPSKNVRSINTIQIQVSEPTNNDYADLISWPPSFN